MGDTGEEIISPKALIIPTIASTSGQTNPLKGSLALSGAVLVYYNGSAWKYVIGA